MKCRICGRDCPPGAKICRDCAAARKRAFAQTVTQPLLAAVGAPSVGEPRFAPKPVRRPAANDAAVVRVAVPTEPAAALPLTAVPRKFGALWLLLAVAVVAAVVALVLRTGNGAHVTDEPVHVEAPVTPAVAPPLPSPQAVHDTMSESLKNDAAPAKPPLIKVPRKAVPHREAPAPVIAEPLPAPEAAPLVRPAPPPPRPVDPPRPDPWQAMNEGLARCAREALFDRIDCEQRLRLQYCANSWGLVPQCPIGPASQELR